MIEHTSGIYAIINKTKNKVYIGKTLNIEYRIQQHKSALERNVHFNKEMQKDFNNKDRFCFIVLEKTNCKNAFSEENNIKEALYILCCQRYGYNLYNSKRDYYDSFIIRICHTNQHFQKLNKAMQQKNRIGTFIN